MIIHSIRLTNFGLYAGNQVLNPARATGRQGAVTLIGGVNGRGKTTFLESIMLALYGRRSPAVVERDGSYLAYLEGLIHRGAAKNDGAAVELELEIPIEGDPTFLRIRRSWKVVNVRASERLEIWRDGVEDTNLASNWDAYVEDLIPIGVAGLFFFDGEKISALAEEVETGDSLRGAIRSLLGLDLVDRLLADLNAVVRRKQVLVKDLPGKEVLDQLAKEIDRVQSAQRHHEQEVGHKQNEILRLEADQKQREVDYIQQGGSFAQSREKLEAEQRQYQAQLDEIRRNLINLAAGPLPLLMVLPPLNKLNHQVAAEHQVKEAKALLPVLQDHDRKLLAHLQEQGLGDHLLGMVTTFLADARVQVEMAAGAENSLTISSVGQRQLHEFILSGQHGLREQVIGLLHSYEQTEAQLDQVNRHLLFRVNEAGVSEALQELAGVTQRLVEARHHKDRLVKEIEGLIASKKVAIQRYNSLVEKALAQAGVHDDARRSIKLALQSQKTQQEFARLITERKISLLAEEVTTAFRELVHKANLAFAIKINPDTLRISLFDAEGEEVPKSRLSSGEKQMLALAILWGLARASGRDLPVIIDTPLGRLDSSHRTHFVERYLPNASRQVIVLSTDTEIVGPYFEALAGIVGRTYFLQYDEESKRTTVEDGYFSGEGESAL